MLNKVKEFGKKVCNKVKSVFSKLNKITENEIIENTFYNLLTLIIVLLLVLKFGIEITLYILIAFLVLYLLGILIFIAYITKNRK